MRNHMKKEIWLIIVVPVFSVFCHIGQGGASFELSWCSHISFNGISIF